MQFHIQTPLKTSPSCQQVGPVTRLQQGDATEFFYVTARQCHIVIVVIYNGI